ncbi:hypothetical protein PI125_g24447 [Phytophthora idaei]|nr:hypothetical protein PI125_g24447 [Phytophthora idaei]
MMKRAKSTTSTGPSKYKRAKAAFANLPVAPTAYDAAVPVAKQAIPAINTTSAAPSNHDQAKIASLSQPGALVAASSADKHSVPTNLATSCSSETTSTHKLAKIVPVSCEAAPVGAIAAAERPTVVFGHPLSGSYGVERTTNSVHTNHHRRAHKR